jgi:tetrahydromethanopterin S-methyltransferase subunit G
MLTGNKELLNKLGALEKQIEVVKKEIQKRIDNQLSDDDGYVIVYLKEIGQYMIMDKDFSYSKEGE